MKARMAAYGGYQLRDYFVGRGALTIIATITSTLNIVQSRLLTIWVSPFKAIVC